MDVDEVIADPNKPIGLRERKKENVRTAILVTAERMFRERGFDGTSMTDIAEDAGISRKTLFNYMATKESIVFALIDSFVGKNMPGWLEPETPFHHDPRDIITPDLTVRLEEIARNRWLLTLAAEHTSFFHADKTKFVDEALQRNLQARSRRIAAVQAEGHIRGDIPSLSISRYYEVLRDLAISQWLLTPDSTTEDLQRGFADAMAVLQQGLAPSDPEEPKPTRRRATGP